MEGRAERAPYFHKSWVLVAFGAVPDEEFEDRLRTSYKIDRSGLTKKVQSALDPI